MKIFFFCFWIVECIGCLYNFRILGKVKEGRIEVILDFLFFSLEFLLFWIKLCLFEIYVLKF